MFLSCPVLTKSFILLPVLKRTWQFMLSFHGPWCQHMQAIDITAMYLYVESVWHCNFTEVLEKCRWKVPLDWNNYSATLSWSFQENHLGKLLHEVMICDIGRQGYTIPSLQSSLSVGKKIAESNNKNKQKIIKTKWDLQTYFQNFGIAFPLPHIFSCLYDVMRNMLNYNTSFIAIPSFLLFSNLECTLKLTASVLSL